jgi:uncharacterized protein (DUF924 family)
MQAVAGNPMAMDSDQVLAFWFQECSPSQWFVKDQAFDELLRQRFIGLTRHAIAGELAAWAEAPGVDWHWCCC